MFQKCLSRGHPDKIKIFFNLTILKHFCGFFQTFHGYQIEDGKLTLQPQEAAVVSRVFTLYLEGKLQREISDTLNADGILYSPERPVWTKFRIGFILRNQRYIGVDGYPVLIDAEIFQSVQSKLQKKWGDHTRRDRPVSVLREKLRCPCGGRLKRWFSSVHRPDTLYLRCAECGGVHASSRGRIHSL